MKRLTLEKTWKYCLSMWRWIAKRKREGNKQSIYTLKAEWLANHGFGLDEIKDDCFFCHHSSSCSLCPGTRIDEDFNCINVEYNYQTKPIAFYNKVVSLNRKRTKT